MKRPIAAGDKFDVRFLYGDASYEHVIVAAPNYVSSMDRGFDSRRTLKEPAMIRLRRT